MGLLSKKTAVEKAAAKEKRQTDRAERKEVRQDSRARRKNVRQQARAHRKEVRQDDRAERKQARPEARSASKERRQDARADRKEVRQDARAAKKVARQTARAGKKSTRQDARAGKKNIRQDRRAAQKVIRRSDAAGSTKRTQKQGVREAARDDIESANRKKRGAIEDIESAKKSTIKSVRDQKRSDIDTITLTEIRDLAGMSTTNELTFHVRLALDLLSLTYAAQWESATSLADARGVPDGLEGQGAVCKLRGAVVRNGVAITRGDFTSDTECFVARSDAGDVVLSFRGSEPTFAKKDGSIRDWVLTDFRANRIPYPPAPNNWPDQRWVHAGIWQAYELVRTQVLVEVGRQAAGLPSAARIFVTGFSLGGALALLAAMDIGVAFPGRVELHTFAAPRAGDASLNNLLATRVTKSVHVAFRGDPVVHLPPLGPNIPVTFKKPVGVDLGKIHVGLGKLVPEIAQQYRTADTLIYMDKNGEVSTRYPMGKVALNFLDHNWSRYRAALQGTRDVQSASRAAKSAQPAFSGGTR